MFRHLTRQLRRLRTKIEKKRRLNEWKNRKYMDRIKLNLNIYFKNKIKRLRFNPQLESDKGYYKIELKNFYQVHKELGENIHIGPLL